MTSGFNVGIVQVVGQAISKAKLTNLNKNITAIGLCKWGSIKDVKNITDPQYIKRQVGFVVRTADQDNVGDMFFPPENQQASS